METPATDQQPLVLIIDDNRQNVQLLKIYLESRDYRTEVAYDGEEGIAMAESVRPDLVLLDVMLPGVDGFEVCRRLKNHPDLPFLPIIMLTALNEPQARLKGLEEGADDYLSKPFDRLELYSRVKNLVRLKALVEERMRLAQSLEVERRLKELLKEFVYAFSGGVFLMVEQDELEAVRRDGEEMAAMDIVQAEDVGKARTLTEERLLGMGMDRDRVFDMVVCVSEAATNAIKHADRGRLSIRRFGEAVQVWVEDEGRGLDMHLVARSTLLKGFSTKMTLGYGFTILRELLDRVLLNTSNTGTRVVLEMMLAAEEEPPLDRLFPSLAENT